jgi:hypothetical protein
VAGVLTSDMFDIGTTIDPSTLDKIRRRVLLFSRGEDRTPEEDRELEALTRDLAKLGFNYELSDPIQKTVSTALARTHAETMKSLSKDEREGLDEYASSLVKTYLEETTK